MEKFILRKYWGDKLTGLGEMDQALFGIGLQQEKH